MDERLHETSGTSLSLSPPVNRLATTSLTLAMVGWVIYLLQWCFDLTVGLILAATTAGGSAVCATVLDVLPFGLWIAGVVSGHVSLGQLRVSGGAGRGQAIWGLILCYVGLFFTIILILVVTGLIVTGVHAGWFNKILPPFLK